MSRSRPISAAYLERKLRSISGVAGDNPLPDLSDLAGFVILEQDRPEWKFPANELQYIAKISTGVPAGGLVAVVSFENPANSNVLGVVEAIYARALADLSLWLDVTSGAPTQKGFNRDLRQGAVGAGSVTAACGLRAFVTEALGASGQGPIGTIAANPGTPAYETGALFIVPPGRNIAVKTATNVFADVTYVWRERAFEGISELK